MAYAENTTLLNLEPPIGEKGFLLLKPLALVGMVPFREESFSTELTGM